MAESQFDPYHKWLGIPPRDQPPHHYRLLGIELFEADLDVIEHAADQRMAYVRTLQQGVNAAASQQLLNEIAAAIACLLQPDRKAAYDAELRSKSDAPLPAFRPATSQTNNASPLRPGAEQRLPSPALPSAVAIPSAGTPVGGERAMPSPAMPAGDMPVLADVMPVARGTAKFARPAPRKGKPLLQAQPLAIPTSDAPPVVEIPPTYSALSRYNALTQRQQQMGELAVRLGIASLAGDLLAIVTVCCCPLFVLLLGSATVVSGIGLSCAVQSAGATKTTGLVLNGLALFIALSMLLIMLIVVARPR